MSDPNAPKLNANDLAALVRDALTSAVTTSTEDERRQVLAWAEQVSPLVTAYAAQAALGDARAQEMLAHIAAQGQAKAWELCIALNASVADGMGNVAAVAARVAGSFLGGLVARFGAVALGLAAV